MTENTGFRDARVKPEHDGPHDLISGAQPPKAAFTIGLTLPKSIWPA